MMNTQQLIKFINTALVSQDNNQRSQAENQLVQYQSANSSIFFLQCAEIIADERNQPDLRQRAATVASRLLGLKNSNNAVYHWDQIRPEQKQAFKQKILGVLISPISVVMRAGASILAVIASIELPRGEWENIIEILGQNCVNNDLNIKTASITTLGYICEQIRNVGQNINDRLCEQILGSIILGTRQPEEIIIQASLKALENSLGFLGSLMRHNKYRDTVFEVLTNNFKNGRFAAQTYQALYEFVKVSSKYLSNYKKALLDLAEVHLELRSQETIFNLQLWQAIGSQYNEKVTNQRQRVGEDTQKQQNFLQTVAQELLPSIMKCLLILKKKEQDEQGLRASAIMALETFAKVCDRKVIDVITDSVAKIIGSDDPNHQQATVLLFSTISEYQNRDFVVELFTNGFDHLFTLLTCPNKLVVTNSLQGFVRLSESFPEVFLTHKNITDIIRIIFDFLNVDKKQIKGTSIQILANISEGLKENPQPISDDPSILLTKIVKFYTDNMLQMHTNQPQANEKLTAIIMNIVMNTSKREVIVQLIEFMMDQYYKYLDQKIPGTQLLLQQTLSVLHTCILAHKNAIPNNDILGKICDLITTHFKHAGVDAEGLSLLGATATTFNKSFQSRAISFLNYAYMGLDSTDQVPTFKAALACIGDFARMMESGFFNNAGQVMKRLLILIKSNLDRQLKLSIISCIGDLILSMQSFGQAFIEQIINISDICFQAVYNLTNSNKDVDYVDDLKATLIEMYSCCVFSLNNNRPCRQLYEHFGNLATFVVRTCNKQVHPTVDYLKSCLYLVFDSAAFYWNVPQYHEKVNEITLSNQINQLINLIANYNDRHEVKELLDFIKSRRRI